MYVCNMLTHVSKRTIIPKWHFYTPVERYMETHSHLLRYYASSNMYASSCQRNFKFILGKHEHV